MENQIYSVTISITKKAEQTDDKFISSFKKKVAKGLKIAGINIPGDKLEIMNVSQSKHDTTIEVIYEDYPESPQKEKATMFRGVDVSENASNKLEGE